MRRFAACFLIVAVVFGTAYCLREATAKDPKKVRRAKPPTFDGSATNKVFFNDVFTEALQGERPANFGQPAGPGPRQGVVGTDPGSGSDSGSGGGLHAWAKVISPSAIEDEIKAIKLTVDKDITTPTKFASSGFKKARKSFSMLAMLFAITAEYDGDVRWKKDAHNLRDVFARSAGNAKVGTIQVYNEGRSFSDVELEVLET